MLRRAVLLGSGRGCSLLREKRLRAATWCPRDAAERACWSLLTAVPLREVCGREAACVRRACLFFFSRYAGDGFVRYCGSLGLLRVWLLSFKEVVLLGRHVRFVFAFFSSFSLLARETSARMLSSTSFYVLVRLCTSLWFLCVWVLILSSGGAGAAVHGVLASWP